MLPRFSRLTTAGGTLMLFAVPALALTAFGPPVWRALAARSGSQAAARAGPSAVTPARPNQEEAVLDQFAETNASLNAKYITKDNLIFAREIPQTKLALAKAASGSLLQHHLMQQIALYEHQVAELNAVLRRFGHNPQQLADALLNEERHWAQEATEFNRHFSQELLSGSPFSFTSRFYL
jgi:hypothetical protein